MQLLNSFLTILAETAAFPLKNLLTAKLLLDEEKWWRHKKGIWEIPLGIGCISRKNKTKNVQSLAKNQPISANWRGEINIVMLQCRRCEPILERFVSDSSKHKGA